MSTLRSFARAALGFVLGDDWSIAVGVTLALGVTALIADSNVAAWWVMPPAVLLVLAASLRRVARAARPEPRARAPEKPSASGTP
jgi:hypothetical protein